MLTGDVNNADCLYVSQQSVSELMSLGHIHMGQTLGTWSHDLNLCRF